MVVGILQVELSISWSASLKDKRRVVASLKDRLAREYRVSIAEIDQQEDVRTAVLGLAVVSNQVTHAQSVLSKALNRITGFPDCEMVDHTTEILSGR